MLMGVMSMVLEMLYEVPKLFEDTCAPSDSSWRFVPTALARARARRFERPRACGMGGGAGTALPADGDDGKDDGSVV